MNSLTEANALSVKLGFLEIIANGDIAIALVFVLALFYLLLRFVTKGKPWWRT